MDQTSSPDPETTDPTRAPYEPPRVVDSAEFETLALTCGKETNNDFCILVTGTSAS